MNNYYILGILIRQHRFDFENFNTYKINIIKLSHFQKFLVVFLIILSSFICTIQKRLRFEFNHKFWIIRHNDLILLKILTKLKIVKFVLKLSRHYGRNATSGNESFNGSRNIENGGANKSGGISPSMLICRVLSLHLTQLWKFSKSSNKIIKGFQLKSWEVYKSFNVNPIRRKKKKKKFFFTCHLLLQMSFVTIQVTLITNDK